MDVRSKLSSFHITGEFIFEAERNITQVYLKSTNDHQSVDVKLGNVQTEFLQYFRRQSSLGKTYK